MPYEVLLLLLCTSTFDFDSHHAHATPCPALPSSPILSDPIPCLPCHATLLYYWTVREHGPRLAPGLRATDRTSTLFYRPVTLLPYWTKGVPKHGYHHSYYTIIGQCLQYYNDKCGTDVFSSPFPFPPLAASRKEEDFTEFSSGLSLQSILCSWNIVLSMVTRRKKKSFPLPRDMQEGKKRKKNSDRKCMSADIYIIDHVVWGFDRQNEWQCQMPEKKRCPLLHPVLGESMLLRRKRERRTKRE